jgi:N-acetyl-anhydromuramyl-L-alanine amidase AmpD
MYIDATGVVADARVRRAIKPAIEGRPMPTVHGIIVHQTDSASAASTLGQYTRPGSNGAHFLIDKDGTVYQTASVLKQTRHVGILKSRCISTRMCSASEFKAASKLKIHDLSRREQAKPWPQRFPSNQDAIGIELVGKFLPATGKYESVTAAQSASLRWLVRELTIELGVPAHEVFRHPEVSYKQISEAESAKW